ncbi:hypothetical protein HO173_013442 [Letharia columbiana]|uniref:Uncharacterized protein n=1 Tax=Letharia columbiana TaxID=112416 RepID=A0A8H6CFD5_9LECA|nr:uncharacterized protein HO173_013442 [Letharia columbiana]KAF6222464.1 hypothetical protein HO173_013442 [Letharia columbiana]
MGPPIDAMARPPQKILCSLTNHLFCRIIRITFTIPVFAILAFLGILLESRAVYLIPLTEVYESFALGGFFFLLCAWIHPNGSERERILNREGKLGMYNRVWFFVFQQPFVMIVLVVVQEITQAAGVFCATSKNIQFAHVWISSFSSVTTTFAIGAVLRFHGATKQMTAQQKPLLKLVSFKGIVFLSWIQSVRTSLTDFPYS